MARLERQRRLDGCGGLAGERGDLREFEATEEAQQDDEVAIGMVSFEVEVPARPA